MNNLQLLQPFAVGFGIGAAISIQLLIVVVSTPREDDKPLRWDGIPEWKIKLARLKRLNWSIFLLAPFACGIGVFAVWWIIALSMGILP